jgi:DNA (cytosine-5)-methyltransferase 1
MNNKRKPTVLGLFSGGGGLDLGFSLAGFEIKVSSDVIPAYLETIELNRGRYFSDAHRTICADVSSIDPADFGLTTVDFMIGGPPCQSFSAAGRRAGGVHGVNDVRGSLFWHYCRLIKHFNPRGFLFENVRGLLQANKGRDWSLIHNAFSDLGYVLSYRILDAADYGVPQHRERLIVVGLRDQEFLFPRPTHGPDSPTKTPHIGVGAALADLDDPGEEVPPYGGKWGNLLVDIPPGMNYLFFTEEMGHPKPCFAWRSRFSDFLYKLDPALPSKTIVASQGKYGGPFHWRGRKLTLAEHKRLQSFPDEYKVNGSLLVALKQIGNSVAPQFAQVLGRAVMKQIFDARCEDVELMPANTQLSFDNRKRQKANRTRNNRAATTGQSSQLSLWGGCDRRLADEDVSERFVWRYVGPRERRDDDEDSVATPFQVSAALKSRQWRVTVRERGKEKKTVMRLQLDFNNDVDRGFDQIEVTLTSSTAEFAAVAWDAVDWCIRRHTSFASIQPLYGHFTEPHPKFTLRVDIESDKNHGLVSFIRELTNDSYIRAVHPLDTLKRFFPKANPSDSAKYLRSLGWDIRLHETNRAIPQGYFRAAYPFTLSIFEPRFTTWREKGTDLQADRTTIPQ